MLRATPALSKMASTKGGMRKILKKRLPVQKYIELAVKAGSYKSPSTRPNYLGLHDVPPPANRGYLTQQEKEMRIKLQRGIIDYPTEYEILSLNPPLPMPRKTPVRMRKRLLSDRKKLIAKQKRERRRQGLPEDEALPSELPSMDRLVRSYLRRHEDMMRSGMSPSQSRREEEYYSRLLLGQDSKEEAKEEAAQKHARLASQSSLQTAMGRKSALVENAYAFALKQQEVMTRSAASGDELVSEEESVERVEQLLREEARADRQRGHQAAEDVREWRSGLEVAEAEAGEGDAKEGGGAEAAEEEDDDEDDDDEDDDEDDGTTLPSILHDRPRAIRAMNIWSARLRSIPYSRWTIGASTALDHWIAREVLQMEELTWQKVLEGGGTDAYVEGMEGTHLPGGEGKAGLMDRTRDIVLVRGALFPETLREEEYAGTGGEGGLSGDGDDGLLSTDDSSATEKSIDELLASLGELDDDDGESWKLFDDDDDEKDKKGEEEEGEDDADEDKRMASILDELRVWRERNASSPYEVWDVDRKKEFDQWIESYVATLYPDADASTVDKEATRNSLLSERPVGSGDTKEFWTKVRTETEAEVFLRDYRTSAEAKLKLLNEAQAALTDEESTTKLALEAVLSVPFDKQLDKLAKMATLRPLLDEYAPSRERSDFFEKYSSIFLEGLEMEHLVPDPDGPIGLDDIGPDLREDLSREWTPSSGESDDDGGREPRFAIRTIAYGTDEFGTTRAGRARELYRLWNEHKANRARFEEALFKKGHLGLEEDGVRIRRKDKGKKDKGKKK